MTDLVVFPHCDVHVALNGTPPLRIQVNRRDPAQPTPTHYVLADITSSCTFDYFAPHRAPGQRFHQFATVDPATGLVTPHAVGTNLVQVAWNVPGVGEFFSIVRIQVHDRILGWWFGNDSITTAVDPQFAHAQPSIYALFSDDNSGTDRVGDITGHGYVALASASPGRFAVAPQGRLRGIAEGDGTLNGTFLASTKPLPVHVVDYARARNDLEAVQVANINAPADMHNIVFLAEGFREADQAQFNRIVEKVVADMFDKPRHSPYPMLEGSFNIWKAFHSSREHTLTCGFRVTDTAAGGVGTGVPIPYGRHPKDAGDKYTVESLVHRVGLPAANEARDATALRNVWSASTLTDFQAGMVDDDLVEAWKGQRSRGILHARDTFFGLRLGRRLADTPSRFEGTSVRRPPNETPNAANLRAFVKRIYTIYENEATRSLLPDPRRHPPDLLGSPWSGTNHNNAILRYLSGLRWRFAPHPNIGQEWIPDPNDAQFRRSRGLVAIIANDGIIGGSNFGNNTLTGNTLKRGNSLSFQYTTPAPANETPMRRTPPATIDEEVDDIIDTVAHEFGHSFGLLDEYEHFPDDDPNAALNPNVDADGDNVARRAAIYRNAVIQNNRLVYADRQIVPDKIKWFDLLRVDLSDRLIRDSERDGPRMRVTIDRRFIGPWVTAKEQGRQAYVRAPRISPAGRQLPLAYGEDVALVRLDIGEIDQAAGTLMLGGLEMPAPPPIFPRGSWVYVPRHDSEGNLVWLVPKKVREHLESTHLPLNVDPDITKVNKDADEPVSISGFKAPCKGYKLVGVYEGAVEFAGSMYRPTGLCKMRKQEDEGTGDGEFCHVCKHLIVMRVDPGLLGLLDKSQYPEPKKGG